MADGQVVFEISGDNRGIRRTLNDTTNAIESAGRNWDRSAKDSADGMGKSFTDMFKRISAAAVAAKVGQVLADWSKQAIQAASDLQEVQNVVDVTFGEGAAQIEKWAQSAGQQFGLTETQAKRFTSTLGAMMKSAGLAGPEIVNMSTDLAGLAADMASFYNLDFDTAFQKIRSGISGETEPLKQLGINMSVVNLEAFALSQGIEKAFNQMSQGEQTLLRYQYLMQATADAQGDFARTSDGFANATRALETNLDQLKTNIGKTLLPIVAEVVNGINDMLSALTQSPPRTVLDDFADIDLKTDEKLAAIQATADEADTLVETLEDIAGKKISATSLTSFVDSLSGSLEGLDDAMTAAKSGDYAGTISAIAQAMEQNTGTSADKWKTLLSAIGDKLPDAVNAELDDKGQTEAFLSAAGAAAASLGGEYPGLWEDFLTVLGDDAGAAISAMANGATAAAALETLANGANALNPSVDVEKWRKLLGVLSRNGNFNFTGIGGGIEELATALNGTDPGTDRAKAWQELLGALSADVEGLSKLTGTSAQETAAWLEQLAVGANALNPDSAEGWDKLFGQLLQGLPGLKDSEYGDLFDDLNSGVDDSERYLRALGYDTDAITDKQAAWLEVCKRLVQTIPGLNEIINTETGEVKGGVQAIRDYVNAWEEGQTKLAMMGALEQKESALAQRFADLPGLQLDAAVADRRLRKYRAQMDALLDKYGISKENLDYSEPLSVEMVESKGISTEDWKAYNDLAAGQWELEKSAKSTAEAYTRQKEAADEAKLALVEYKETVDELPGTIDEAAEAATEWSEDQKTAVTEALEATTKALDEVEKYYQKTRDGIMSGLEGAAGGFSSVTTPAQKAKDEMQSLTKEIKELNAAGKDTSGVRKTFSALNDSIPTVQNMTSALQSQLDYLNQYQNDLKKAQELGVSADLLASLSDGSVESADYLHALATTGSAAEIEQLNAKYAEVAAKREELATSLTDTRLNADTEFQGLVDAADAAIEDLNNKYDPAKSAMENTVQGIADGIAAKIPSVQTQVDVLNTILAGIGNIGGTIGSALGVRFHLDGSHALGLDYVPFDNYLAALHEGESILTAEEAKVWRDFKYGGAAKLNSIDYDAMGGVMRDNIKAGGNVYLDGRTVGRVISEQQGNSLRALERSGWQE